MITFSSSGVALVLRGNILKVFMLQYTINSNIKFMFYNIKNRKHQVYLDASRPKKQRYER
jgi:glycerol-3-phosphate responsive antiterminator